MVNRISKKIELWQQACPDGPSYNDINSFIRFRAQESFETYHPTDGPHPRFETRLEKWLDNITDPNEQRKLFELVPRLYFFGENEFKALYRASFREIIINWLIDLRSIDILNSNLQQEIQSAVDKTWFCSATDSMDIAGFCHVNMIHGHPDRPSWRSFAEFADMTKVKDYIDKRGIEQIVILEDFIGTGNQFLGKDEKDKKTTILHCLKAIGSSYRVLVLPLIACQSGIDNINNTAEIEECTWVESKAAFILSEACFIPEDINNNQISLYISKMNNEEKKDFFELHSLIEKIGQQHRFRYGPFGYGQAGSLVVLYSNCSDNTLAIVYENTSSWSALFPRTSRVTS